MRVCGLSVNRGIAGISRADRVRHRTRVCLLLPHSLPLQGGLSSRLSAQTEISPALSSCSACIFHLLMKATELSEVDSQLLSGAWIAKK